MQLLGLALILINIGAIVTPIAGVVLLNSNDLSQLIIPSDIKEIAQKTMGIEENFELPEFLGLSVDQKSRTAQVIFKFTNPFNFNLTLNTFSATVKCIDHNIELGYAALKEQIEIKVKQTQKIRIKFVWTKTAEDHFLNVHSSEEEIEVELVDIKLDVSGVTVELPETVTLTLPMIL
jgi:hypothetical protein